MTLDAAIEVFVRGFSHGRNLTSPHLVERIDGLWVMHDPPERKNPRKTEIVTCGLAPSDALARIQGLAIGWHFLCDVHPPDADYEAIRQAYKDGGYRAVSTEGLFVHSLREIPEFNSDPKVRLVRSGEELSEVRQRASQRRKYNADRRLYGIWDDKEDLGWVESVPVGENAWVAGLHVFADKRGRGYGRALMSRLLLDDQKLGIKASVLLASSDGARLYPHLGYEKTGILQMFCPKERN